MSICLEHLARDVTRIAKDTSLCVFEVMRYVWHDSRAGIDLLNKRKLSFMDFEQENRLVAAAKIKALAEKSQQVAKANFESVSKDVRLEFVDSTNRRYTLLKKYLVKFGELQLKHAQVSKKRYMHES